jgi:hypothetical protein
MTDVRYFFDAMIFSIANPSADPTPPKKNHTKMLKSNFFLHTSNLCCNFAASIIKFDANKKQERRIIQRKRQRSAA